MNGFAAQSIQTMSELMDLAAVPFMVLAPRDGKPVIEVVQDSMVGSFRLTQDHVKIHDKTMANLQMVNTYFSGALPEPKNAEEHMYAGRQAFSQILPPSMFIEMKNKKGQKVVINNSEHVSGAIDKPVFHSISRGILPILFHDYGPFEVKRFLDNLQRLVCRWLMSSGFSVGISDLVIDKTTAEKLKQTITTMKTKAYKKIEEVRKGNLDNNSIFNNEDFFEREIINILNETTKMVGSIGLEQIDEKTNRMINMVKSGSKGKETNVAQMIACVGQQNVDGKRVAYGFTDRTLPHYNKFDDGPEARGFVENSFISGLTPQEVFFHAMGGREGLIDTAVKSVSSDTKLVIIENGKSKVVQIGEWIDGHMERCKDRVQYKEDKHTELLELDNDVWIPDMTSKGDMQWSKMKYVTRHDPDNELYEVTTLSGRKVVVTQYDSMLVWDKDKQEFLPKPTTDIKIGEFVPITSKLPRPPVLVHEVHVADYLPKNSYLYGSDFWKAKQMMDEAMGERTQIPRGWWEKHNGNDFTLPYSSKARLQRVMVRSDLTAINEGCVYNFAAQRGVCSIPEHFPLDKDFGTFIGLYLAEGSCHAKTGKVSIANVDINVKSFVKKWFDKYGVTHQEMEREVDIKNQEKEIVSKGLTCSVEGNSTMLAKFLDKFVGHGAHNKFVPNEAFAAPDEFVLGLLNGYFAGDGTVGKNNIATSSCSEALTQGISFLCSRFGVFGKMSQVQSKTNNVGTQNIRPSYRLDIRSRFAQRLRAKVDFLINYKNERLKNLNCSDVHRNYPEENDIVMDPIQSIVPLDASKYPKVYDVTIPGTYNFQLFNGLNVRDTSETGYIQRRLVKAMEDCKVYYDHTVRNATGVIVQFLYGEDGMDGTRMETQIIPTIDMNILDIEDAHYLRPEDNLKVIMTEEAYASLGKGDTWERCEKHFQRIVEDREFLISKIFHGDKVSKLTFPIPFERILKNAHDRMKSVGLAVPTDLTPIYILDTIEELKKTLKIQDMTQGTRFLHILLHLHLSPKPVLFKYNMPKTIFDWVVSEIRRYYIQAIAHPGEMVGIIAAQTIGENSTQLVLDSFHSSGTVAAVKATSGVPRFKELLSVSKNIKTPILTIHLKDDIGAVYNPVEDADGNIADARVQQAKERAIKVMQSLEITRLVDILDSSEIYWDPCSDDGSETALREDQGFLEVYRAFQELDENRSRSTEPWVLRMKLNKVKMYRLGITMLDVYVKIHTAYSQIIDCLFSDDNADELIFRVRMKDAGMKEIDGEDAIAALKAIEHNLIHNVLLKGMKGIKKVSMHMKSSTVYGKDKDGNDIIKLKDAEAYADEELQFQKKAEWILDTDGSNLIDILANPNVDSTKTRCNDIWEIYHTLGIEAARSAIYNEIMDIIGEDSMNYRHMSLLIDTMTNRGQLMSVDRHGINRGDVGPLAKSSFEETTDMLINASVFSEYDRINGVSANIMLGQLPPCGTGDSEVMLDEEEYLKAIQSATFPSDTQEAPAEMDDHVRELIDTTCTYQSVALQYKLPAKKTRTMPVV